MNPGNFALIDAALVGWSRANGIHFGTEYQDSEVRSFDVVSRSGTRVQVWIEWVSDGVFDVVAWNYRSKGRSLKERFRAKASEITDALDSAMNAAKEW